jgi:hypothetical protein
MFLLLFFTRFLLVLLVDSSVLWDADGDGRSSPTERAVLARAPGINHGLTLDGGFLYASSPAALYRYDSASCSSSFITPSPFISNKLFASLLYYVANYILTPRWRYQPGDRHSLGEPQLVIANIPSDGHQTRTPVFDARGQLYLSLGSQSNVDPDSRHARVLRFNLTSVLLFCFVLDFSEFVHANF